MLGMLMEETAKCGNSLPEKERGRALPTRLLFPSLSKGKLLVYVLIAEARRLGPRKRFRSHLLVFLFTLPSSRFTGHRHSLHRAGTH